MVLVTVVIPWAPPRLPCGVGGLRMRARMGSRLPARPPPPPPKQLRRTLMRTCPAGLPLGCLAQVARTPQPQGTLMRTFPAGLPQQRCPAVPASPPTLMTMRTFLGAQRNSSSGSTPGSRQLQHLMMMQTSLAAPQPPSPLPLPPLLPTPLQALRVRRDSRCLRAAPP